MSFLRPFAGWMTCAPLATEAANAGRLSGRAQRCLRRIAISGSAVSETEGTGATGRNCARAWLRSVAISARISSPSERTLLRLDGQYGTGAVLSDVAGFAFVTRGKDYSVLDHPLVQARLHLPPDQFQQRPESQMVRSLYDCPQIPVGPDGVLCRVVVATHPARKKKSPVGVTRAGVVYELFFTNLPQHAFTACDVVELYLHRGAFEPLLSDEDQEIDPDRWCSHSAWGQECWQLISQWVWNLRLELGHQLRTDAAAHDRVCSCSPDLNSQAATCQPHPLLPLAMVHRPPPPPGKRVASPEHDFPLQPDGTLRCPAGQHAPAA